MFLVQSRTFAYVYVLSPWKIPIKTQLKCLSMYPYNQLMWHTLSLWGFICTCHLQAINDNDIHNIVLSYLVHNCYKETVDSFISCTGMKQPANCLEDMEMRKSRWSFFSCIQCIIHLWICLVLSVVTQYFLLGYVIVIPHMLLLYWQINLLLHVYHVCRYSEV